MSDLEYKNDNINGRSWDRPNRSRFSLVFICPRANGTMVFKIHWHCMLVSQSFRHVLRNPLPHMQPSQPYQSVVIMLHWKHTASFNPVTLATVRFPSPCFLYFPTPSPAFTLPLAEGQAGRWNEWYWRHLTSEDGIEQEVQTLLAHHSLTPCKIARTKKY